jgi:hypothetical protein
MHFDDYPNDVHRCPIVFFDPRYVPANLVRVELNIVVNNTYAQVYFVADPVVRMADFVFLPNNTRYNRNSQVGGWTLSNISSALKGCNSGHSLSG